MKGRSDGGRVVSGVGGDGEWSGGGCGVGWGGW